MRHFFIQTLGIALLFLLFSSGNLKGQALPDSGDCINAVAICTNFYSCPTQANGQGIVPNEINAVTSCLKSGELNGCWYTFTVQTGGLLNFTITPLNNDDYDWALYNLSNSTCAQIHNNPALEVSCNYSGAAGPTGPNGLPGAQNNPPVPVIAGQTYVLYISHFTSGNAQGYTFDLGATTATIYDASTPYPKEIVNTPAGTPLACGLSKITIKFSEYIKCNSVSTADLAVYCPNGIQHNISSVQCKTTGGHSNMFDLNLAPALLDSGLHKVYLTRVNPISVTDLCGNSASSSTLFSKDTVSFRVKGINRTLQHTDINCFGDTTGTAKIVVTNGTSPYTYSWLTTPIKTSASITNLKGGNYTCIVKDSKGCSIRDSVFILERPQLVPGVTASWDTCGKGTGVAYASISGGQSPYVYQWDDLYHQTKDTATHLRQGTYTVIIKDALNCDTSISINIGTAPIIHPAFDYDPKSISLFFPDCYFTDHSQNAVSWFWNFGDGDTTSIQSPYHKFEKEGTFPVKLYIKNTYGCEDSVTSDIYVDGFYTLYLANSFTPNNDGKNDVFQVKGTGLIPAKFLMQIYARNGQMIYQTNDIEKGWDGTCKGDQVMEDVYVYDITFMDYKYKLHNRRGVITLGH